MSNNKRPSTKKMKDYENEKIEVAEEMGIIDPNDVEVNTKIASQDEPPHASKTTVKKHNLNNPNKTVGRKNL